MTENLNRLNETISYHRLNLSYDTYKLPIVGNTDLNYFRWIIPREEFQDVDSELEFCGRPLLTKIEANTGNNSFIHSIKLTF